MSDTITVRRNWKKKINNLCNITTFNTFSLHNDFIGKEENINPIEMAKFVDTYLNTYKHTRLRYNKETGKCSLNVHSNLWYEWTCKIDW